MKQSDVCLGHVSVPSFSELFVLCSFLPWASFLGSVFLRRVKRCYGIPAGWAKGLLNTAMQVARYATLGQNI